MPRLFFKHDLLNHFKAIRPLLERAGAKGQVDALTLQLRVRLGEQAYELYPQFIKFDEGRKQYTPYLGAEVTRFIGWRPYASKRWPLSDEKLKFKAFAAKKGLATPQYSADPQAKLADVIVKRNVSSFAMDIKGPFRSSAECRIDAAAGGFYEPLRRGAQREDLLYWDARPVCLEIEKGPTVAGDGRSTVRELVQAALEPGKRLEPQRIEGNITSSS